MSGSLINIGLTGLKTHQTALASTGNNVTNANTPGYTRQRVEFQATDSNYTGAGYQGTGVTITNIERTTSQFLITQVRTDTALHSELAAFEANIEQIDSLLADPSTGLSPGLSNFFGALQGVADDPSAIPERELVISQAQGLINRFDVLYGRLQAQKNAIDQNLKAQIAEINSLAAGIAQLNQAVSTSTGLASGQTPNDLLDKRDELLRQLSEITQVTAVDAGDGSINVLIGKGQALVVGARANTLITQTSQDDPQELQIALSEQGRVNEITSEMSGGEIGGLLRFRDTILRDAFNSVGRIAVVLADTINTQHQKGIDLEGNLGGLFFGDVNSDALMRARVIASKGNALPDDRVMKVEIVDSSQLTTKDYRIRFEGPSNQDLAIIDDETGQLIQRALLPSPLPATLDIDGMRIHFEAGSFQTGDSFLIVPTRYGARDIMLDIDRVEEVALASPVRTEASLGNVGNATISQGELLDVEHPATGNLLSQFQTNGALTPPLIVRFITDNVYEILDNSDPANPVPLNPPVTNRTYVTGVNNDLFTSDPGQTQISAEGTDVGTIPAPAAAVPNNGYSGQTLTIQNRDPDTGIVTTQAPLTINANESAKNIATLLTQRQGVKAFAYTLVTLTNFVDDAAGASPGLSINGRTLTLPAGGTFGPDDYVDLINNDSVLQDQGIIAKSDGTTLTIRSTTGEDIRVTVSGSAGDSVDIQTPTAGPATVSGGNETTVGGFVDVLLDDGVTLTASNSSIFTPAPVARSTYTGFQVQLDGEPKAGDTFTVAFNASGVSDNRNGLAMVNLENAGILDGNVSTYNEAYGQLVEVIGSAANQAKIDEEASKSLLQQSENRLQSMAGVNLDEEAGKLIQFQAAYNASAQVVSIARELFDTLLGTFR
ncbi:MAG: flagellar hook-associated protein FlgK [Gammaproteobacteria bacterium]|nr:MAG: flagellar hook-associated protein FlgK [Gammaproteobacteria bacterium]